MAWLQPPEQRWFASWPFNSYLVNGIRGQTFWEMECFSVISRWRGRLGR